MLLQTVILNLLVCIIWISMNVQTKLHKCSILVTHYKRVHVFTFTKYSDKSTHDLRLYHKFWEFLRTGFWNHIIFQLASSNFESKVKICHFLVEKEFNFNYCIGDLHVKSSFLMMYELHLRNLKLNRTWKLKSFQITE